MLRRHKKNGFKNCLTHKIINCKGETVCGNEIGLVELNRKLFRRKN